jgi:hypothetical protein
MANINGKTYALTAFTRMHPLKTFGLRAVFALIRLTLQPLWISGLVAGAVLALLASGLLALLRLAGLPFGPEAAIGAALGIDGIAGWLVGMAIIAGAGAALGVFITVVLKPSWTVLGKVRKVQENLIELSFIHFARWVIVPRNRFPHLDPSQPRERLAYDYLLFESNFNGDWEKYIDAFSEVVPGGMDNIWRWSVRYPQSRPITPFLAYIRNCQYDTDHYYSAYPGAATNDLLGALKLTAEIESLAQATAQATPEEFEAAYDAFLVRVQNCLATTGPPPAPTITRGRGVGHPYTARVADDQRTPHGSAA